MSRVPDPPINPAIYGERPMTIKRRVARERERMLGMTDEERAWRKKWLDAQKLAPEEPIEPKGMYKEMYNPIRRLYKTPMDKFQKSLERYLGYTAAFMTRHFITKSFMGLCGIYYMYYYFKYNKMDWTRYGGWKVYVSRPMMYPDTKDLNVLYKTKGNQFYVNDFDKSPIKL